MDFSSFSPALILVTVVSLALAPFVAVMVTSFTKIVVVLSLLRNALGLQQVPPNVVINGLAIVLSIYVMYPVLLDTHAAVSGQMQAPAASATAVPAVPTPGRRVAAGMDGVTSTVDSTAELVEAALPPEGLQNGEAGEETNDPAGSAAPSGAAAASTTAGGATATEPARPLPKPLAPGERMDTERLLALVDVGKEPLRGFLIKHSSDAERAFFLRSAQRLLPPARQAEVGVDDFIVVVPAFTVSELTAAFQIGFLIFLPFLIIDLVVANILLALGMMMMSPTTVSLPFKLLLFVLIDGWAKLVHGLVLTYGI